jgi:hypothetical protein
MTAIYAVRAVPFVVYDGSNSTEVLAVLGAEMTGFTVIDTTEAGGVLSVDWEIDLGSYSSGTVTLNAGDVLRAGYNETVTAVDWAAQYVKA